MRIKSLSRLLLLLLVTAATAFGADDEWSWAVEAKESSILPKHEALEETLPQSTSSHDVLPVEGAVGKSAFTIDALPLANDDETLIYEVLPLAAEGETLALESLPLSSEPLPLEPHAAAGGSGVATFSVSGEGELVDGLVLAPEGDREGRFLGLGDKLCSFGIGINCNNKKPQYAPPKVGGPQGSYGPPSPIKTHYSAPKPTVPQGSYGLPLPHPPKPPVFPNRDYNVAQPTKAPFSPINGLLSVLKPFMPTLKPKAPPKVSKGGPLTPSYTAPNPNYAPLLPSYTPPVKATYAAPTPSYSAPPSAYHPPKPAYVAPRPSYAAPAVHVAHTKPAFVAPRPSYVAPAVHVAHSKPAYVAPKPAYSAPKPAYDVQSSYSAPKRVYVEPKPAYANAVPTVTVHAHPTVVEQHHHTHTHLYNDKTVHNDIYKDDHNGVLQSVHDSINQINQHTLHREDVVGISTHSSNRNSVQIAQPSVKHVVVQQQIPATSPSPSIIPAVLVGGTNFQPGKMETGFQPSQAVLEPLFRPRRPTYREDCQCVPVGFCSAQDVIARNAPADLSNVIDARTRGSSILSNATDATNSTEFAADSLAGQGSSRRGKAFDFSKVIEEEDVTEEATEEVTEAVTEYWLNYDESTTDISLDYDETATEAPVELTTVEEEKIRRRREANTTSEEEQEDEEDPALYSDRQGRQLKGFTPDGNGCGPNYVCCRRPVFKARRQQFTCGQRSAAGLLGRVKTAHFVQGDSEFGEYPWQAAVLKSEDGDILYQCGGTLIDNRHVLTAAHCVEGIHPSQLKIRLGEWDVSGQTEFYNHVEMRASGAYLHPEYYAGNLNNDIAVIRLEHFLDFSSNPHISPVCLPEKNADFTHQRCHATGWGKDAFGSEGKFSQVLKEVEVPVFERQQCQQTLQATRLGPSFTLHEGNFCAGGEEGRDTCKGDGGGPLVCSGTNGGGMQLAGLVSWGIGCGNPGVPGVYVKVSHYIDWINDITRF